MKRKNILVRALALVSIIISTCDVYGQQHTDDLLIKTAGICVSGNHESDDIKTLKDGSTAFAIPSLSKLADVLEGKVLDVGDFYVISATTDLLEYADRQYGPEAKETIRCRRSVITACYSTDWQKAYDLSKQNKEYATAISLKKPEDTSLLQLKLLCWAEHLAIRINRDTDNPDIWKQVVDIEKEAELLLGKGMAENEELVELCRYMATLKTNETVYPGYVNFLIQKCFPQGTYLVGRSYDNDVYSTAEAFMLMALDGSRNLWGEHDLRRIRTEMNALSIQIRHHLADYETLHQNIVDVEGFVSSYLPEGDILTIDVELLKWECDLAYQQGLYEIRTPFPVLLKIAKYYGSESECYLDYANRLLYIQSQINLETAALLANEITRLEEQLFLHSNPDIYGVHLLNLFTLRQGQAMQDPQVISDYMSQLTDFYLEHHHPSWPSIFLGRYIAFIYQQAFQEPLKGLDVYRIAIEDTKLLAGKESYIYAFCISEYLWYNSEIIDKKKLGEAELQCLDAILLFEKMRISYPQNYRTLFNVQQGLGKYNEALQTLRIGIEHCTLPQDKLWRCRLQLLLGRELLNQLSPLDTEVEKLFKEAIQTFTDFEEHFDGGYFECYLCIGYYYTSTREYQKAEQIYRKGLDRYRQLCIQQDWVYSQLVSDLYGLYVFTLNDIDKGEQLLKEYGTNLDDSDNTFTDACQRLELLWNRYYAIKSGNPDDLTLRSAALNDVVKKVGDAAKLAGGDLSEHQEIALPLICELGELCSFIGEKEKLVELAKTEEEKKMAGMLLEMSAQFKTMSKEMLKPYCEEQIGQLKNEDVDYLDKEKTRMLYYTLANYYLGVECDTLRANDCYKAVAASTKPAIKADAQKELALLNIRQRKYVEAASLLELSCKELISNPWVSNETKAFLYNNLYSSYYRIGKWREAIGPAKAFYELRQQLITQNFDLLTEAERESFVNQGGAGGDGIELLVAKFPKELSGDAYNAILAEKGLLLRASERVKKAIAASSDFRLTQLVDSLNLLKLVYKRMSAQPNLSKGYVTLDSTYIVTKRKIESLEREVNRRAKSFMPSQSATTWKLVQQKLQAHEAAIEFLFSDSITGALVLLPHGEPCYVPLTNSYELSKQLGVMNQYPMKKRTELIYEKDELHLYEKLWKPLEKVLVGASTIYFSPSGYLNQLAFAAIKCDDNNYLSDRYELHQMLSTGNIVQQNSIPTPVISATLFGGVCYSEEQVALVLQKTKLQGKVDNQRGAVIDEDETFGYLPYTMQEVDGVLKLLESRHVKTVVRTELEATEEYFCQISSMSPNVIHLSTHGYFINDEAEVLRNKYMARFPATRFSSLQRCGLALERANLTWAGQTDRPENNDGILTASEVAKLNLNNTRLAVLSACQTATGHYSAEGVYGTHRGFKQAGVRSILGTLWNVNDKSTARLMELFYERWLSGMPMQQSLSEAVRELRKEYPSPFYWAPFVLMDAEN